MDNRAPIRLCVAALLLIMRPAGRAQSDPPSVMGVTLGDSASAVLQVLGAPERRQESLGLRFWDFTERGVSITIDKADGRVHVIIVTSDAAGSIAGVRVGDPVREVRTRWGTPARIRDHGRFLDFVHRGWTCTAEIHGGAVSEITLTLVERAP